MPPEPRLPEPEPAATIRPPEEQPPQVRLGLAGELGAEPAALEALRPPDQTGPVIT
jgi:hypothetical protein